VRALKKRERIGALVVDAHGLDGHTFDASLSRKLGGTTTIFGALELVTISKLLLSFTCFYFYNIIHSMLMFLIFELHVVFTCLDVEFVKLAFIHI